MAQALTTVKAVEPRCVEGARAVGGEIEEAVACGAVAVLPQGSLHCVIAGNNLCQFATQVGSNAAAVLPHESMFPVIDLPRLARKRELACSGDGF